MAEPVLQYRIVSKDESKQGVASAENGFERLKKGANDLAKVLTGAFIGHAALAALRNISAYATDAEGAFNKLHPSLSKSAGSTQVFSTASEGLKVIEVVS